MTLARPASAPGLGAREVGALFRVPASRRAAFLLIAAATSLGCEPGRLAAVPTVDVSLDPLGVVALAAGAEHTCALRAGGTVVCWGSNEVGQIGVDGGGIAWTPREVSGVTDAVQIAGAAGVTCARRKGGAVRCWGAVRKAFPLSSKDDVAGVAGAREIAVGPDKLTVLLGDGSVVQKSLRDDSPARRVEGVPPAVQVSAGYRHACALLPNHDVRCWGRNGMGELGDGTTRASDRPVRVVDLADAGRIGTSQRGNCAWRANGNVSCWGNLGAGRPFTEPFTLPLVSGLLGAAGGIGMACAVFANGTVDCVKRGAVGPDRSRVGRVQNAVQVVAGYHHFCALERSGRVLCWGSDERGQLGDPAAVSASPRRVPGIDDARDLVVARSYACAVRASGGVACWGKHPFHESGEGADDGGAPHAIADLAAARLTTNGFDACALDPAGVARCWGTGLRWAGVASTATPTPLPGISGARRMALGFDFACALVDGGGVRCAGKNRHGELGDGTQIERREPVAVKGIAGAVEVATSDGLVCARLSDGHASCWGTTALTDDAPAPPLFIATNDDVYSLEPMIPNAAAIKDRAVASPSPRIVVGVDEVSWIGRVGIDLCAVRRDGTAACWSRADRLAPRSVEGLTHARALAGSRHHRCALLDDQRVACWGANDFGELGTGASGPAVAQPVVVTGVQGAEQLAAGEGFTCARIRDGSVQCWGSGRFGELGTAGYGDRRAPVEVPRSALRITSPPSHGG